MMTVSLLVAAPMLFGASLMAPVMVVAVLATPAPYPAGVAATLFSASTDILISAAER